MKQISKEQAFDLGAFDSLWDVASKPVWKPDTLKPGEMTAPMYAAWVFKKTGKQLSEGRARAILRDMYRNNLSTRRDVRLETPRSWQWAYLPSANLQNKDKK
jgi:hypothetical protein